MAYAFCNRCKGDLVIAESVSDFMADFELVEISLQDALTTLKFNRSHVEGKTQLFGAALSVS